MFSISFEGPLCKVQQHAQCKNPSHPSNYHQFIQVEYQFSNDWTTFPIANTSHWKIATDWSRSDMSSFKTSLQIEKETVSVILDFSIDQKNGSQLFGKLSEKSRGRFLSTKIKIHNTNEITLTQQLHNLHSNAPMQLRSEQSR